MLAKFFCQHADCIASGVEQFQPVRRRFALMFAKLFQRRPVSPFKLRRGSFDTVSLAGVCGGVLVLIFYLTAPVVMVQQSLSTTPVSARTTTPTVEFGGATLDFDELVWQARSAEYKCDEWIARASALGLPANQKLSFELSCRCGHRYERVKRVFEKFLDANREHPRAAEELERFTRVMTEKIAAVLEFESLREENPKSPEAWHSLATYFNNQGLLARAFECYEKALAQPQQDALLIEELALTQFMFRGEAARHYSLAPEEALIHALATYRRAMAADPKNFNLARRFAECFFVLRPVRATEGLAAWEHAVAVATTDTERHEALLGCARFAVTAGRLGYARVLLVRITLPEFAEHKERVERTVQLKLQLRAEALPAASPTALPE